MKFIWLLVKGVLFVIISAAVALISFHFIEGMVRMIDSLEEFFK